MCGWRIGMKGLILTAVVAAALAATPASAHIPTDCEPEYREQYAARQLVAHRLERLADTVFAGSSQLDLERAFASVLTTLRDDEDAFNRLMDCIRAN